MLDYNLTDEPVYQQGWASLLANMSPPYNPTTMEQELQPAATMPVVNSGLQVEAVLSRALDEIESYLRDHI